MRTMQSALSAFYAAALVMMPAATTHADELGDKGREILKKYQRTVVTVQVVLKNNVSVGGMGSQSRESRQDVTGTVLDPSGLVVLSLSTIDPAQLMQNLLSGDENRFKVETELADIKILTEDGSEIPAEVVLRDRDLDLAFVRPKAKPATPMEALDLSSPGKAQVLDEVISLNRLGKATGRAYAASVERISAVVQRPRLFYVPESGVTTTALGSPAFTVDGKALGVFVMRASRERGDNSLGVLSGQSGNVTGIIVPLDDVMKAMKQVPAQQ